MKVDIITCVKNGEAYILEAIQSVKDQSFKNWVYYIVNDGSTDETRTILENEAAKDDRIRVIHQNSSGASKALNKALKIGNSEYVAFIDHDDLWEYNKLEKQLDVFLNDNSLNFCFTMVKEFDEIKTINSHSFRARISPLKGYIKSALLFRRNVIESLGYFNENLAMGELLDWMSKPIHQKENLFVIDEVLTHRRVHGENMTANVNKGDFLKILKKHLDQRK